MTNYKKHSTRKLGLIMLLIGWILIILLVWVIYSEVIFAPKSMEIKTINGTTQIKLYPELDGHYRILGSINQQEINFLVDTGATTIAIPITIAKKFNLPRLGLTSVITAGGRSRAFYTNLDKLKIGNVVMSDVKALIVEDMKGDTALLGMNVINKFNIEQNKDFMILKIDTN